MRVMVESAAKARAVFNPGTTRGQAWDALTKMFREPHSSSLVGGSYSLQPVRQHRGPGVLTIGDTFKYATHADTHYVRITALNPFNAFAYEELWRPAAGSDYDHPKAGDTILTMEFRISDHPEFLVLDVRRTHRGTLPFWTALVSRFAEKQGIAFAVLSSLLGPQSREATSWAAGWKRLPLDAAQAVVKPDRFKGPSLVEPG